ncbi:MAG: hypothetical protein OXN25_15080 [Candidatus Poribacteria bacterium]|nr:hypothetical protein [Candidatus Poribacteria bacterium]
MFYKSLFLTIVLMVSLIGCQQPDNSAYIKALEDQIQTLEDRVDILESKQTEQTTTDMSSDTSKEFERINLQIQDLYYMTEPLRTQVIDKMEGNYSYAFYGRTVRGMLPSQLKMAELYYKIRSHEMSDLGFSEDEVKALTAELESYMSNPYFTRYKAKYLYDMSELTYHPDLRAYVESFRGK